MVEAATKAHDDQHFFHRHSHLREFICGGTAAAINIIVTFVPNKIMFRQQLYGTSTVDAWKSIRDDGWPRLYRGVRPPLMQAAVSKSIMFGLYNSYHAKLTTTFGNHIGGLSTSHYAAFLSGTTEAVLTPFERIQTLLQTTKYNTTFSSAADAVVQVTRRGPRELYRGVTAILIRNAPSNIIFFGLREPVRDLLPETTSSHAIFAADFVSGAVLGAFLSTLFFPLNVEALELTYHERGGSWVKVYRGVHINFVRSLITWELDLTLYTESNIHKCHCTLSPGRALKGYADADRLFLHQVLYGCVRYKDVLKVVLSNFYQDNSAKCSRNDYTKFLIMGYLALFRLDEIGMAGFHGFVSTHNPTAMHVFLAYLFDDAILHGPVKAEWLRLLDQEFVETQLIAKLEKHRPEIDQVLGHLHAKAFGMAAARESLKQSGGVVRVASKQPTVPVAPNITKPKPRAIPEPTRIPLETKAHPVPDLNKLTLADIQDHQKHRRDAMKEQVRASTTTAYLATVRSNLEAIKQEVEAQRMAEVNRKFKAKPAPTFSDKDAPVKLNTAAILREDALYKKKQEKEAKLIQAYESDLRDASEFYRWQSDMIKKDDAAHRAQVETRRLEMVQAQHEAIEARVLVLIIEMAIDDSNRQGALEIKLTREVAPREAEERVKSDNHRKREAVNAMLETERARKAAQDAIDQAQREDLIRQIRALDRVHREHVAIFDPTESANLGLLDEMSLVELRERLQLRKVEEAELEAQRRELILQEKKEREADLKSRVSNISRIRQEGELVANKRMFLGAAKNMLEVRHFMQQTMGAERQASNRQNAVQTEARVESQTKHMDTKIRQTYRHKQAMQHEASMRENDAALDKAMGETKQRLRHDKDMRKAVVHHEQARRGHAAEILQHRNMYATQVSAADVANGRTFRLAAASNQVGQS
ncbi:hypothetical protein DYB34_005477 [Aphanomyces astaci]|uniref:Uncharacterized protein n=1 Tax=Aphanomyces astaci TaxID=112090 RepID=A0A418BFT6_APHAT|nr:hypothetical protein DYB34_005477 [Aphanomyces astaci]